MNIDPIFVEVSYDASPEKIWEAITDRDKMKQWYFDIPNFKPEVGHEFSFYEPGGNKFLHQCKITELSPNQKLQYTWSYPDFSKGITKVTWLIEPLKNSTKVSLIHEGIENLRDGGEDFARENFEAGWREILGESLKKFVES